MASAKPSPKPTVKPKVIPKPTVKPKVTPKPTPSKTKAPSIMDELIKSGVKKLSPGQKAQIAKLLGIDYDPKKITNPNYKGNPKDLKPDWWKQ
jgi:hypothetical protein